MGQFFDSNPAAAGAKRGPWRQGLPRTWKAALDLDDGDGPDEERRDEPAGQRLGPSDGTLSLRTGRHGAAAKAGHDLLIHVTKWEAVLSIPDDGDASLALDIDGGSLRVIEGSGGMKALTDSDKADIRTTIDDEILKRQPIVFRSTQAQPRADGQGLSVEGDLTLLGETRPLAFDVALTPEGTVTAETVITQSLWGIEPYSTLFGTLKVNDDIRVAIEAKLPG